MCEYAHDTDEMKFLHTIGIAKTKGTGTSLNGCACLLFEQVLKGINFFKGLLFSLLIV